MYVRFGRRLSLTAFYAISGVALVLSQVIPEQSGKSKKSKVTDTSVIPIRRRYLPVGMHATGQPTRLTQPFILPGSINEQ